MSSFFEGLNADVLDYMCTLLYISHDGRKSLKALSSTSRRMRITALPRLFRTMRVSGSSRKCTDSMRDILAFDKPLQYARTFKVYLDGLREPFRGDNRANAAAQAQVPIDAMTFSATLVALLEAAQGIQHFALVARPNLATFISSLLNPTFVAAGIRLDNMTSLNVPSCCVALADACPSVVRLQLDVSRGTSEEEEGAEARIWGARTGLTSLKITLRSPKDLNYIQVVTQSMQHLAKLEIRARMRFSAEISRLGHLLGMHTLTIRQYESPRDPEQLLAVRTETNETKRSARRFLPQLRILRIGGAVYDFSKLQTDNLDELDALEAET
ncbi:hypothetical protein EXIGLDRAFT_745118 [Exidia glandulosa HHB12029]|uniref:F-box domain-containing protein n=1 Tax=Exidia glandulosa HHB12029 TaxID=1314781 RepID=A0A166BI87_EXIGL|nr:hypothetical protein EXIGLDRAFT_745118 [Exidia glandulosa HHB12029]